MPKILLAVSALAAVLAAGSMTRANAAPLGNPAALSGAAEDVAVVDTVHCRPGWRHHNSNRWRRGDGCSRDVRRGVVVVAPGRTRYVIRDGVRVRVGSEGTIRSRTTIRSNRTTIRSGQESDTRSGSTTIRSRTTTGTESGSTTIRSGSQGGTQGGAATTGSGQRGSGSGQGSGATQRGSSQGGGGQGGSQSGSQGGGGQAPAGGGSQ